MPALQQIHPQPLNALEPTGIVISSSDLGNVIYGLSLAAAIASLGAPSVEVMVTMEAVGYFVNPPPPHHGLRLDLMKKPGIPDFNELVETCKASGVTFRVCPMGLACLGITTTKLRRDLAFEEGKLVEFLRKSLSGGQLIAL